MSTLQRVSACFGTFLKVEAFIYNGLRFGKLKNFPKFHKFSRE
jgi:hypothetical protein